MILKEIKSPRPSQEVISKWASMVMFCWIDHLNTPSPGQFGCGEGAKEVELSPRMLELASPKKRRQNPEVQCFCIFWLGKVKGG